MISSTDFDRLKKLIVIVVTLLALNSNLVLASKNNHKQLVGWDQAIPQNIQRQTNQYPDAFHIKGTKKGKNIALSFDDGPSEHTTELLKILKQYKVKATFFWLGKAIENHPEIVKQAYQQGHLIANHSFSHAKLNQLSAEQLWKNEILPTQNLLKSLINYQPKLFRAPFGEITDQQIEYLAKHQMKVIGWSLDSNDWRYSQDENGHKNIISIIQDHYESNSIIVMHDGGGDRHQTLLAVKKLIPEMQAKGYSLVTIDEILQ